MSKWVFILIAIFASCCPDQPVTCPEGEPCDPIIKECDYKPAKIHLPGEMIYGKVTGLKNCRPFEASAEAYIHKSLNFIGVVFNTYEQLSIIADKESVSLVAQAQGDYIGKWPLLLDTIPNLRHQVYYILQDYHEFEANFMIDNSYQENHIEFSLIDSIELIIKGSFEAKFIITSPDLNGQNPDTVLFSNCVFEAWHPE